MSIKDLNYKIIILEKIIKELEKQNELLLDRNDKLMNFIGDRDIKIIDLEMESVERLINKPYEYKQ